MHIADIRSRVRGDQTRPHLVVAFARRHGVAPFLTRAARPGGRWGHTALWDETRGVFNEALVFDGVVETPQEKWFETYSAHDLIAVPCRDPQRGIDWAREQAATPNTLYDYRGAWSVLYRGDWQDGHRLYCTEHEIQALARGGLNLFADPTRGTHPHDLWRVCAAFAHSVGFGQTLHAA